MCAQVCAVRLPVDVLDQHMAQILEGLLLWSEDSKNKFRLKVQPVYLWTFHAHNVPSSV